MPYIRIKKINNTLYAYLVESINSKFGPRQKVKLYLGRVHVLRNTCEKREVAVKKIIPEKIIYENNKGLLLSLISDELKRHGFKNEKDKLLRENITFDSNRFSVCNKSKKVVLSLNEGFLCDFTMQRLAGFRKTKDLNSDALKLARYFLDAGLQVNEKDFVKFYELL